MAIDLCSASESCSGLGVSPRISFSHDLRHSDVVPVEQYSQRSDASLLDSSFDFDFGVTTASFEQEPPFSADDLFFDGKILPCEIREKTLKIPPSMKQTHHQPMPPPPPPPPLTLLPLCPPPSPTDATTTTMSKTTTVKTDNSKKESLKEIMATSTESEDKASSKSSFWRFRRSSSLNSGNGQRRSLICSLPLLSRSNSTGSPTTNSKRQPLLKDNQKHSHKPPTPTPAKSSSSSSSSFFSQSQKPPLKKNGGSYGNGIRISPILNIPPPYIAKGTANLFGLGSLFCGGGKDKNRKK